MEEEETKRLLDEEDEVSDEEENSEELQGMTKAKEKEKESSLVVTLSEFLADAPPPKMPPKAAKLFYGTPSPLPESFHKERRDRVFTAYENREKYPVGFPGFPLRLGGYPYHSTSTREISVLIDPSLFDPVPPSKSSTYPKSSTTADQSLPPLPPRPTKIYVTPSNESVVYATDDVSRSFFNGPR